MDRRLLVALLVAVGLPAVVISQQTCTGVKVYQQCGTACPPTCDNPTPLFCTQQCVSGCFCPAGYVLNRDGDCVQPNQCPSATQAPVATPPVCPSGMTFNRCGTACPLTCENPEPRPCTRNCVVGCFCPRDMLQHNGRCVQRSQCPTTTQAPVATPPVCSNGMTFNRCGTACPLTCENPEPGPCTRNCVDGCFCPLGMLQHNGRCVQRSQCPTSTSSPPTTTPGPTCTNNRIYSTCGTACPLTCENRHDPPTACIDSCEIGCFCPIGLLQDGDRCVTADQCSDEPTTSPPATVAATPTPTCPDGKVFLSCGSSCPSTCESLANPGPVACTLNCVPGCFCPYGMVLNGDRCVQPSQCPQATTSEVVVVTPTTPTCPPGMAYRECGPICRMTCSFNACFSLRCAPGCFCPEDQYEVDGRCVSDCSNAVSTPASTEVPVTEPVCTNGKVFSNCVSSCRQTCQNLYAPPRPCPLYCMAGCQCPNGLIEDTDRDRCVPRDQCRNPCDSVRCASQCVVGYDGRAMCAPDCRVNNGNCSAGHVCTRNNYTCTQGRYCDLGRFVNCSAPTVTPPPPTAVTPPPPTAPVCPSGMTFNQCGTRCPLTCEYPDPRPCVKICQPGCFCPKELLENNGTCVMRSQCPPRPTRPPVSVCSSKVCTGSSRCVVSNRTGEAKCVPTCHVNNGNCSRDQTCEIQAVGCGSSNSRQPCDSYFFRQCKDAPFVPCGSDAFLACDSEWTNCLQQNVTRRASCVASCLSRNGNCDEDSVCITNFTSTGSPTLQCLQRNDLPTDCPAGQVMNACGDACQATCDSHLKGPKICPLICGPPACVCPPHLVLFRDRCVDPRLCYVLTTYPPPINPLPVVKQNSVLLSMVTRPMSQEAFETAQDRFLMSVQNTLNSMTNQQVNIRLHGTYVDSSSGSPTLTIVVEVTGDSVSRDQAQSYANILNQNSHLLYIEVDSVQPQEVIYVDTGADESQGLSNTAIIGIAVGSAVVALCFVSVWIALVACCCVLNRRMTTKASAFARSPSPSEQPFVFSDMGVEENDYVVTPQDNKGKLIKESLMY